jgi:hypothetical protein
MVRLVSALVALSLALVACAAAPEPSAEVIAVPTQTPGPPLDLGPQACPAALLEGMLVRHEEAGLAVQGDPNFSATLTVWPHGWAARDVDGVRELLDADGNVVARDGDFVSAGGGMDATDTAFVPCGEIEFTPAGN